MTDAADELAAERYRLLVERRPGLFENSDADGIVILFGAERIAAESELARRHAARGWPDGWARAGLYYEDAWLWLVRDVVRFPDGDVGTYSRLIAKGGEDAVAVIPRFAGRLLLLRHFRHGVRCASLEFPRGGGETGTPPEELVRIELREELGVAVSSLRSLGWSHCQTNLQKTRMHLFLADVDGPGTPAEGEGIVGVVAVTPDDLARMVAAGEVTDSTTINLLAMARLKGAL